MKKQNLKSLKLNKKSISKFESNVKGGADTKAAANTFTSYWAYCPTRDIDCAHSDRHTNCWCADM